MKLVLALVVVVAMVEAGVNRKDASHLSNTARSFLDTQNGKNAQQEVDKSGKAHSQCSHVHCKIERHQCFYNPNTHSGTAFSKNIAVCRDFAQEHACAQKQTQSGCALDKKCDWYNGKCTDPAVRGHNFGTHPNGAPPADCSHLPQMWAGTMRNYQAILNQFPKSEYGNAPFQSADGWYRAQTCTGQGTHYSIRTFHNSKENLCAEWGHKCGIGINTNKFQCECRACQQGEAGCSQDPSGWKQVPYKVSAGVGQSAGPSATHGTNQYV